MPGATEPTPPREGDPLESAWVALRAQWDDPARHKAFVVLAGSLDRLTDAAARYRAVENEPALSAGAARGKELVVAQAIARLESTPRTSREEAQKLGRWVTPLAALGLMIACNFLAAALTRNASLRSPGLVALEIAVVALLPWRRFLR